MSEDNRRTQRRRVLKSGLIVFNNLNSTVSCTVRNLSGTGALLRLESTLGVPDDFELRMDGTRHFCRTVRRTGTEIAVAFERDANA